MSKKMHKNSMKLNHVNDRKGDVDLHSPMPVINESNHEDNDENKENHQIALYEDTNFSTIYDDYDGNEGINKARSSDLGIDTFDVLQDHSFYLKYDFFFQ